MACLPEFTVHVVWAGRLHALFLQCTAGGLHGEVLTSLDIEGRWCSIEAWCSFFG